MSTIDITVAEQPFPLSSGTRAAGATTAVQHVPGFYVGTVFIPDSLPNDEERLRTGQASDIAQQWMAFAKRSSSQR